MLRAEARRKYQVMINYIKEQVDPGYEYSNDLVRVVFSERGCYYEFLDMPEEFSGALGNGFQHQFVGSGTGLELTEQIYQASLAADDSNTREFSLMFIYERTGLFDRDGTFIYQRLSKDQDQVVPTSAGHYRPGVLPLFFKVKVDSELAVPFLGTRRGVIFFAANMTDQHLLVRIPQFAGQVTDLNELPASRMIQ